jgi:plastocyanin
MYDLRAMKRHGLAILTIGILGLVIVPARAAPPVGISIHGRSYDPPTVQVPVGTNVRWTNDETGSLLSAAPNHTVTSDDGIFDSGTIPPGGNFRVRFTRAGSFAYHCEIHSTMHGLVVVDGATGSPTPTASASPSATSSPKASPSPTRSASRKASPKATPSASVVAEAAPRNDGVSSSAGTIISVAIAAIAVLVGLGYVVYLRFLRAPL